MQDDYDPNKVVFQEFEVNDGVTDEQKNNDTGRIGS